MTDVFGAECLEVGFSRINYAKVAPGVFEAMLSLANCLRKCGLEGSLLNLVACALRRSADVRSALICTRKTWAPPARMSSDCMDLMLGRSLPIIRIGSERRSRGQQ